VISRRRFVASTALAAAGSVVAVTSVRAFGEEEASAEIGAAYAAGRACAPETERHRRLVDDLRTELAARNLPPEDAEALIAALTCPVCGCRIGA
jgi:hypothetical protein